MRAKLVNEGIKHLPGKKLSKEEIQRYKKEERLALYSEASWKMDKFMPEDQDAQNEYYEILNNEYLSKEEKINQLEEFLNINIIDESRMYSYFPKNGNIREFAEYLVSEA